MKVKRTERGWAGHYICADQCLFRRNTLLEYKNLRIVISTVGAKEMPKGLKKIHPNKNFDTVGCNRYYETMVFKAKRVEKIYWDANINKEVQFDSPWQIDKINVKSDKEANDMHEKIVDELSDKMKNNKIKYYNY
jgi:hypothetical protein